MNGPALTFRPATRADLPALVGMLANDPLGQTREQATEPLPAAYESAFAAIDADPNNELVAVEDGDGAVIATLQLTFIPSLSLTGGLRLQIESVRVSDACRGRGIGEQVFQWAIERGRARGCRLVQLTTNKTRDDALRFYQRLGFSASHEGLKLMLEPPPGGTG